MTMSKTVNLKVDTYSWYNYIVITIVGTLDTIGNKVRVCPHLFRGRFCFLDSRKCPDNTRCSYFWVF